MLVDGHWSAHEGGYSLKLGEAFLGHVRQRGGGGLYADCWIVSLNGKSLAEESRDRDYAQALVVQLIADELDRIKPSLERLKALLPPRDCFWGQDSYSRWKNWKAEKEIACWTFHAPTPHARRRAPRPAKEAER